MKLGRGHPSPRHSGPREKFPSGASGERVQFDREVAVGVTDGPQTDQSLYPEAGLLAQLAPHGIIGGFPPFDPAPGELPEPRKQARSGPTLDEPLTAFRQHNHGRPDVRPPAAFRPARQRSRVVELAIGAAGVSDRARRTGRLSGTADRLAEFHHRLVERPRLRPGEGRFQDVFKTSPGPRVPHVLFFSGPASRHPEPVRFQRDHRPSEGDRGDRPCDIRSDAGQRLEFPNGRREFSSPFAHEPPGGRVEVMGPRVVAGPLPELEDPFRPRARERPEGGERPHEPLEVRNRLVDASLLQENLRHPDAVRSSVGAPGQLSVVRAVPREKGRGERRRERRRGGRGVSHGTRPRDEAEA